MPNTKYDKFYCQELVKKYPLQDKLDALINKLNDINCESVDDYVKQFVAIVEDRNT